MNKTAAVLCLAAALSAAGSAQALGAQALGAQAQRLVRFGLITDTHVTDKADQAPAISLNATPRYFTGGVAKLEAFGNAMNKAGAAFVAELGDLTDNPSDGSLPYEARKAAALGYLQRAEAAFATFKGPRYHVFGNHDTDQLAKADVKAIAQDSVKGLPAGQYYFSFDQGGVHFIVLDAGYKADGKPYSGVPGSEGSGYAWSDANIPAAEIAWLKADLAATRLPTIVLSHQLLNPEEQVDAAFDPAHSVKNSGEVRAILEKSARVLAVFAGHYHDGGFQQVNGISYVTLQASAAYGNDVSYHNQYATVDVYKDGTKYQVAITGNGVQKSYVLNPVLP